MKIKNKRQKKCFIKRKRKFQDNKNCLKATQPENKMNQLEKNEFDVNSFRKNHKEFMKKIK